MHHFTEDTRTGRGGPGLLPELVSKRHWRSELCSYFRAYLAFHYAGLADWTSTKRHIDDLRTHMRTSDISPAGPLGQLVLYLDGVYHQGIGHFDMALRIFGDAKFDLSTSKSTTLTSAEQVAKDVALLAALNTLWILQDKPRLDQRRNMAILERIRPFCVSHPNYDIRVAWSIVLATVETTSPITVTQVKSPLGMALRYAQTTMNAHFLAIILSIMCGRFFNNVIGPQAEKSAKSASVQAGRSGNKLWMSVTDGMLARFYDVQGKKTEAEATMAQAQRYAEEALPGV